jgi:glyoxalase family protein
VPLEALHHVTAICTEAKRTLGFYRDELGFRLVKKTVNFDDPGSYHLYFGDDAGSPGTLLTFFEWPGASRGRLGRGSYETIGLTVPGTSEVRQLEDPDGLRLELYPGDTPALHHVSAYGDPQEWAQLLAAGAPLLAAEPPPHGGLVGAGTTHHIAWRMADDSEQTEERRRVTGLGYRPTEVLDRKYFRSVYFRLRDGLLFELATDGPGFAVDERAESLGESLALPDWLEPERAKIEAQLTPV